MRDIEDIKEDLRIAEEDVVFENAEIKMHIINRDEAQREVGEFSKELELAELSTPTKD
jgi:hypothetical protein